MSNLLKSLSTMKRASSSERTATIEMTPAQVEQISEKLKAQNRMNVYPNKFNVAKPFRVQTRKGNGQSAVWTQHGYFTNVDVASAVGTICSKALFGDKALAGEFNPEVVENHEEFIAWLSDDRNQEIIAKAEGDVTTTHTADHSAQVAPTPDF